MILTEPLLETIRDTLRDELTNITLPSRSILITNDEKLPSYSGEEFINIYGATTSNEYEPIFQARKEVYSLNIGITRKLIGIPPDISAEAMYTQNETVINRVKQTMITRAYEIIELIDGNWGIPALIRQMGCDSGDCDACILSPLGFTGSSALEEKYAEHFRLEDDGDRPLALFLELQFSGMEVYSDKD
jgi:hypothetical protein